MNLFELFVKIGVDDQASGKLKDLGSKLGNGLKTAAKIGTAAVGAAAAGITALTAAAVNNYAEYEQLVGGIETLFEDLSWDVGQNAAKAFKTAGLSANEYMSTAMSFAASLNQSLLEMDGNIARSADLTDQAILDMADNANKMGSDMSTLQTAYAGFAKQNYTLLDNLKIGYGGTKEEMQRLIADAAKLSDTVDAQSMSFANIVEAIHVVQTEMGITGTTALEAGRTISGSVGAMKAAWQNLLTGFANGNADLETLVEDLVTTIVGDGTENNLGVLGNIMPAVKMALKGAAKVVAQAAPIFAEQLPVLIEEILPDLASATANLIVELAEQIPSMAQTLVDAAFQIADEIGNAFAERIPGLSVIFENLETVVVSLTAAFAAYKAATAISGIIDALRKATEGQTLAQTLLNAVMNANPFVLIATLIAGLVAAIVTLWNTNDDFRNALLSAWDAIKNAAVVVWESIAKFFTEDIPNAFNSVINFVENNWQSLLLFITNPIAGALKLLYDLNPKFREWVDNVWQSIKNGFNKIIDGAKTWGKDLIQNFIDGITEKWNALKEKISSVAQTVKDYIGFSEPEKGPLSNFHTYAPDMIDLFIKGIKDNERKLTDQIEKSFDFGKKTFELKADYHIPKIDYNMDANMEKRPFQTDSAYRDIIINVNGAKYENSHDLANEIAEVLRDKIIRKEGVYA